VKNHSFLLLVAAAVVCPAGLVAQAPKPLSETDLLKQIEALTPGRPAAAKNETPSGPVSLFDPSPADLGKPERKEKSTEKKAKGPTEITSSEAMFDNKANIAVFVGDVVVKDPEFNCTCDKLTAHLKKKVPAPNRGPNNGAEGAPAPVAGQQQRGGGLEKAIAEMKQGGRVYLTQEKTETDGSITHSFGKADRAVYDAVSGDIMLYGSPEVIQGPQKMVAIDPDAVITINRDGKLSSNGKTKAFIIDSPGK
jgi:hypothetical protein